jgi:hypothetical protein
MGADMVICETPNNEENGQKGETDELKGLAANGVERSYSQPVSGNGACADQDTVTSSNIVEPVVDRRTATVADSLKNGSLVETKSVECNLREGQYSFS